METIESEPQKIAMGYDKKIALVAHDNKKKDLMEWAKFNRDLLATHTLYATGTTGATLENELRLEINKPQSGPLGGDQQIGAKIVANEVDFLIFSGTPSSLCRTILMSKHYCEWQWSGISLLLAIALQPISSSHLR